MGVENFPHGFPVFGIREETFPHGFRVFEMEKEGFPHGIRVSRMRGKPFSLGLQFFGTDEEVIFRDFRELGNLHGFIIENRWTTKAVQFRVLADR